MIRRLARSSIAAGVALAGGVAFAGFGVAAAVGTDEGGVPAADADELALVERFAGAVTTFDAGQVEADIERILALGTPTFADEVRSTMAETFAPDLPASGHVSSGAIVALPPLKLLADGPSAFFALGTPQITT